MGEMSTLNKSGDTKQIWDPDNEEEVQAAKDVFNKLTKKGYSAFRVGEKGKKAERMNEFDPDAGKVILVPVVVGG